MRGGGREGGGGRRDVPRKVESEREMTVIESADRPRRYKKMYNRNNVGERE